MQYHVEAAMRQIGLSDAEIERIRIRAERIQRDEAPDGAHVYVAETAEYALRDHFGRKTARRIGLIPALGAQEGTGDVEGLPGEWCGPLLVEEGE